MDGAKPLSEPMLEYCQLDPLEQTSMKFQSEFKHFHSRTCTLKSRLRNGDHFVSASMCQRLPGSNNAQRALTIILIIVRMWCLLVELNIVADSIVYGNRNLGHRGRVIHIGICELGHR